MAVVLTLVEGPLGSDIGIGKMLQARISVTMLNHLAKGTNMQKTTLSSPPIERAIGSWKSARFGCEKRRVS